MRKTSRNRPLVETALPVRTISLQGTAERYSHGKTPHSMHVWWARRPLSAMRALVFATLVNDHDPTMLDLCYTLAHFEPEPLDAISTARPIVKDKIVLDLFGGGGSIALEAARLGCKAISVELNPLAVFIQKTLLNYSQQVANLPALVKHYGLQLLEQLHTDTRELFPSSEPFNETLAYFWARAIVCPNEACRAVLPVKSVIPLQARRGAYVYVTLAPDRSGAIAPHIIHTRTPAEAKGKRLTHCPLCDCAVQDADLRQGHAILPVACCIAQPGGKSFVPYAGDAVPFNALIEQELERIGSDLPATELPRWSGITNPTLYGVTRHSDLFTPRQLLVLLRLIQGLRGLYGQIAREHNPTVARAIIACLSGLIDQLADWNSSFSVWLPTNAQVGRSLAGPGLPMQWAFVEIDPWGRGPANLWDKLDRIVKACEAIPRFAREPQVIAGSATRLDLPDESVDAIITDPPYADNLYYSVLADCIYTWKRLALRDIFPAEFAAASTPTQTEIVASAQRQGDSHKALLFYYHNLKTALAEGYRALKPTGTLSLTFNHSTLDGWMAILLAVLDAGFCVTAAWPFSIERKARPRGLAQGAVHASGVIVASKAGRAKNAKDDDLPRLRAKLEQSGCLPVEVGLTVFIRRAAAALRDAAGDVERARQIVQDCYDQTRLEIPAFRLKSRDML
jgi:putative DNA methylase